MAKKSKSNVSEESDVSNTEVNSSDLSTGNEAQPPSRFARVFTLGHGVSLFSSMTLVYFSWGKLFSRNGTGSNVVLGLLLAVAVLYLGTAHLGPFVDDMLTRPAWRKARQTLRMAWVYVDDIQLLLDRGVRLDKAVFTEVERQRLKEQQQLLRKAAYAVQHPVASDEKDAVPSDASCVHLENIMQRADIEMTSVMGTGKMGVFAQIRSLGFAFTIAIVLRLFVVEPFQIPSGSMIPTMLIGDHLFAARFWYGIPIPFLDKPKYAFRWRNPTPGDVVVFTAPPYVDSNAGEAWIKRVIAGPGQKVFIEKNIVYVDDKPYSIIGKPERMTYKERDGQYWKTESGVRLEEKIGERSHLLIRGLRHASWPTVRSPKFDGLTCDGSSCVVDEGYIFVMGDNRDNSADGRYWGAVPMDNVKGRAFVIWMSVDGSEHSIEAGRFTLPKFRWDRIFTSIR